MHVYSFYFSFAGLLFVLGLTAGRASRTGRPSRAHRLCKSVAESAGQLHDDYACEDDDHLSEELTSTLGLR